MTAAELQPYVCEVQVIDVHRKANYGPSVKLRFADPEQMKHFQKGQRLQIVAVVVNDDETADETRARPVQRAGYKLSQLAGMLCAEPMFWRWCHDAYGQQCENPETAAQWVREVCGVTSRAELDSNAVAAETWRRLLADYDNWKTL